MKLDEFLLLLLIIGMAFMGFKYAMALPEVHYSWSTGECVRVLYSDQTCDTVQKQHISVYVR